MRNLATRYDDESRFEIRASSRERGWVGIDAASVITSGGLIDHPATPRIHLCMQTGEPVVTTSRNNGSIEHHLQTPGDIRILPPGCGAAWVDDGPTQYVGVNLSVSLLQMAADAMGVNFDHITFAPEVQLRDKKIEHIALAIKAELEDEDIYDRTYAEGLGLSLAAHLMSRYSRRHLNGVSRGLTHTQLQRVKDYIHDHHATNLSLVEIASVAGISPSYLKVLFKHSVGLPVHQYIIKCRVERAVHLISTANLNISEIALKSGFTDQSHMSRCMRRFVGLTPAQVRRNVS